MPTSSISEKVRYLMSEGGFMQKDFAEIFSTESQRVSDWLSGHVPHPRTREAIEGAHNYTSCFAPGVSKEAKREFISGYIRGRLDA